MAFLTDLDKSFALDSSHSYSYNMHPVRKYEQNKRDNIQTRLDELEARINQLDRKLQDLQQQQQQQQQHHQSSSISSSSSKFLSWFTS